MAPRRILHVVGTAEAHGNAICQMVERLAAGMHAEEYVAEVLFLRSGEFVERFGNIGIPSTCVDWNGRPTKPIGAARYARVLRASDFDLIHLHTGGRFLTKMSRVLTDAFIVRHVHGHASEETGIVPSMPNLPDSDALIANSKIVADMCRRADAVVIYPGIDVDRFRGERVSGPETVVGTACRLEPVKGIRDLIEAIALLVEAHPALRLEIAGTGTLREALEGDARRLGIADRVRFLGWRDDLPSVMATWKIFVLPSLDEGFGVAALEAMAAGLPVIATAVGGLRELVEDGRTGFLVPSKSPRELAARLRQLFENPELREAMGAAGRQRAGEQFSAEEMVRKTIEVYDSLFEPEGGRSRGRKSVPGNHGYSGSIDGG